MKFLKPIYLLLLVSLMASCGSDKDVIEQDLNISDVEITISNVGLTTAKVMYNGSYSGDNASILYRLKNSSDAYQTANSNTSEFILSNLEKATDYEVTFEVSNNDSNLQTSLYYFTTKAVSFDYETFYAVNGGDFSNAFEIFSHLNKQHVIHGEGLSDYSDVIVYLVNEQRSDSLEIPSTVDADSLTFTIPEDYLSQTPRESLKKAWVGVKIKDSYEYLLNDYGWTNTSSNPDYTPENDPNQAYLNLKIFNDKPYINSVSVLSGSSSSCSNYTNISLLGQYFGVWDYYYWTPQKAELIINNSDGTLYGSFEYIYGSSANGCGEFKVAIATTILEDGLLLYHQRNSAQIRISEFPLGDYSAKIVFTFEGVSQTEETNAFSFTKE